MRCIKCGEVIGYSELCECCKEELDSIVKQIKDFASDIKPYERDIAVDYIFEKLEV